MPRKISEIKNVILDGVLRRSQANYFGPGSVLDTLADDVANITHEAELNQEVILNSVHLDTASESHLEKYARDFNITRASSIRAYSSISDNNVLISTTSGETIQSVLNLNNIILPGLRVTDSSRTKIYIVEGSDVDLTAVSSAYVSVRAVGSGAGYNVGRNELSNFEKSYVKLRITNNFPILNGTDSESSASLKSRVLNKIDSNLRNANAVNAVLQNIPGYGKSTIINNFDGPGSLLVSVQPSTGLAFPQSALADIKTKLIPFLPTGVKVMVKNFDPVAVSIKTRIVANSNADAQQVAANVQSGLTNFFNGFSGGTSLDLENLRIFLLSTVPGLKFISRVGNTFEEVGYTVYEGSSAFNFISSPNGIIPIEMTQIVTLSSIVINYE
jgi:hypothetical protein